MIANCDNCGYPIDCDKEIPNEEPDGELICNECYKERHDDDDFYAEG